MTPFVEAKTAQDRKREKGHTTKLEERNELHGFVDLQCG
jgi:hypothetical protein